MLTLPPTRKSGAKSSGAIRGCTCLRNLLLLARHLYHNLQSGTKPKTICRFGKHLQAMTLSFGQASCRGPLSYSESYGSRTQATSHDHSTAIPAKRAALGATA